VKKIKFAAELEYIEVPKPAIKYLPEWYKKSSPYLKKEKLEINSLRTMKHCIPFMDSMVSGYIHELWSDCEVENDNGVRIHFKGEHKVFGYKTHGSAGNMPVPYGYEEDIWSFHHGLYVKTPPGYSILVTQPFNRTDLPFYALSGIVDADKEPFFPGAYPVFLKQGFSGVIPKGTPMLQIIPFKREDWTSERDESILKQGRITNINAINTIMHWYKKNAWFKKTYE
jgi:hypothetical protein